MSEMYLVIASLVLIIIIYHSRRRRLYELANKIPGENGLPFIGTLYKFLNLELKDYVYEIIKLCDKNSSISKTWFGPKLLVFTQDPDCLHTVFNSQHCLNKPLFMYKGLYTEYGLVAINDKLQEKHRKILNRAFVPKVLQQFIPIFNEKTLICVDKLSDFVDHCEFNVFKYTGLCTLDAFFKGHLNYEFNFYDTNLAELMEESKPLIMKRVFRPWYNFKPLYNISSLRREMDRYLEIIMTYINGALMNNSKFSDEGLDDALIKFLVNKKFEFSDVEIRDEILIFIMGGYETTALSLGAILLMLAMHKDVQAKVIEEIDSLIESNDSVTNEILHKFSYTEMVIKEALRLFPPAGIIARENTEEIELGGYTIPKDTIITLLIFEMHRNPKYWGEEAHLFKPERFEAENFKKINPHAFAPFSGGKRICIGWKYSMIFMKIFLAHFFKAYTVDTSLKMKDLTVEMTPTLDITQKYMISIKRR